MGLRVASTYRMSEHHANAIGAAAQGAGRVWIALGPQSTHNIGTALSFLFRVLGGSGSVRFSDRRKQPSLGRSMFPFSAHTILAAWDEVSKFHVQHGTPLLRNHHAMVSSEEPATRIVKLVRATATQFFWRSIGISSCQIALFVENT